jgi:hypothetical protein
MSKQTVEIQENKSSPGGYAELDLSLNVKIWNAAKSAFTKLRNSGTAEREIVIPDKDITIAGTDDVAASQYNPAITSGDNPNRRIALKTVGNFIYWKFIDEADTKYRPFG